MCLLMCLFIYSLVCVYSCHSMPVKIRGYFPGVTPLRFTIWVPGLTVSKCLYLLSHCAGPNLTFISVSC